MKKHFPSIILGLLIAATVCCAFAWLIAARWLGIESGNFFAWLAAGITAALAAATLDRLVE